MAPRRRRRPTASPARIALILAANLALAAALGRALAGGGPAAAEEPLSEARAGAAVAVAVADAPPRLAEREARALRRAVGDAVARWTREAERRSGGAVSRANARVSVHAREVGAGGELVALEADRTVRPASNMKLVTTAAALILLGPDWAFETRLEAGGPIEGGVLRGDLLARAGGDPLVDPAGADGRVAHLLDGAARAVREAGVRRVAGDLVLDEGAFAGPAPAPGWPDASQHWADYCALAGGFSANGGVLAALVRAGPPPRVEVHPAPHGLATRYDVALGKSLDVRVGATVSRCTVAGTIPSGIPEWRAEFRHPDPVMLFGHVLRDRLRRAGVEVEGGIARRRRDPPGTLLASVRSPLTDSLVPVNTHSRNGVADQVLLALGHAAFGEGTRAAGERAAWLALVRLGVPPEGLVQVDGSGLSRDNRVSARQVTALVEAVLARGDRAAEAFEASLAVAGRTGTLADRMRGTPAEGRVLAKTGWIAGASALSGVAHGAGGRRIVFSVLVEYPRDAGGLNRAVWKPMQDEIAALLVEAGP